MSRNFPSMTALLGLLAVAGYQNRDKIAEMLGHRSASDMIGSLGGKLGGAAGSTPAGRAGQATGGAGGLGGLGGLLAGLGGGGVGGLLSGGLNELLERFGEAGHADKAQSWVGRGPNRECTPDELRQAIGPQALEDLRRHTGLSESELIDRLCRTLKDAVDRYTPDGRVPT